MTEITRRNLLIGGAAAAATGILGGAGAFAGTANAAGSALALPPPSRTEIRRWATDTWASLVAMTDERTGLTADNIDGPLANPESQRVHLTDQHRWLPVECHRGKGSRPDLARGMQRTDLDKTLRTLLTMRHHEPSGMYYNWYDEATGEPLTTWPTDGNTIYPFLSSVDNGWLAAGLMVVQEADRATSKLAQQVVERMNFKPSTIRSSDADLPVGLLRGGFWDGATPPTDPGQQAPVEGNYLGVGPNVWYTQFPLRHHGVRDPHRVLHRHRPRPGPGRSTTSAPGARSPTSTATGRGRSSSRSGRPGTTSASTSSKARTPIAACGSCPVGVARCSRR